MSVKIMNLVVDIGNSAIKMGSFEDEEIIAVKQVPSIKGVDEYINSMGPLNVIIASVRDPAVAHSLRSRQSREILILDYQTDVPITVDYQTPETLGVDRIAAAVGASLLNPRASSLVIDLGSCITYDLIENGTIYKGGMISPGLNLRIKSMHSYTDRLPMIGEDQLRETPNDLPLIGATTEASMENGVINGLVGEIEFVINGYKNQYSISKVLACGGDAKFFEKRLKAGIFVVPNLVLIGLNKILTYNLRK